MDALQVIRFYLNQVYNYLYYDQYIYITHVIILNSKLDTPIFIIKFTPKKFYNN